MTDIAAYAAKADAWRDIVKIGTPIMLTVLARSGCLRQAKKVDRAGSPSSRICSSTVRPQASAMRVKARRPAAAISRGETAGRSISRPGTFTFGQALCHTC